MQLSTRGTRKYLSKISHPSLWNSLGSPRVWGQQGEAVTLYLSIVFLLQLLQRSWLCQWRALSSLVTELCVGSRAPLCLTYSGSARTTCWRKVRWWGRWLRVPRLTTTPSASWEMWSRVSITPAAPPTLWAKNRPPCMSCPPDPRCLWPGPHRRSCCSCLCLWGQRSSCWWGWGCWWCRTELCRESAAGQSNLSWDELMLKII